MKTGWRSWLIGLTALVAAAPFAAPEVLAFPYREDIGQDRIWSVEPIPREIIGSILADANSRVAQSPLATGNEGRRIFLTDGGWRWSVLALGSHGSFALTRPLREDAIFNRSNVLAGTVENGRAIGGVRTLASVIAHEKCHGMVRRRFGIAVGLFKPNWLIEGYCDHVGQESTLTADQARQMQKEGSGHPAIPYALGRERVAQTLATNGGNVDALFAGTR